MAVKIGKDVVALTHRAQCCNKNIFSGTGGMGPEEQGEDGSVSCDLRSGSVFNFFSESHFEQIWAGLREECFRGECSEIPFIFLKWKNLPIRMCCLVELIFIVFTEKFYVPYGCLLGLFYPFILMFFWLETVVKYSKA